MAKVKIKDVVGLQPQLDSKTASQFSPTDLSGLVGWYDFGDQTQYAYPSYTGEQVLKFSQINDKSGVGNHLVQATGANQPTTTSYGGVGDYGCANFVSGTTISCNITLTQPFTIFMVINIKNFVDAAAVMKFASGTNGLYQKTNVYGDVTRHSFGPVTAAYQQNELYFPNQAIALGFVVDSVSTGGGNNTFRMLNGAYGNYYNKVVAGGGGASGTQLTIGGGVTFDIYELILCTGNIGEANMRRVDDYLHRKYPLPVIPTYVAFGDSITYGAHSTSDFASYVVRVAQAKGFDGYVYALPGMDLNNYIRLLYKRTFDKFSKDSYLSFCFGTNAGVSGVVAGWNTSYRTIIKGFIDAGFNPARMILVTPPYTVSRAAYITTMRGYFAQMATDYGVKVADCFDATYNGGATMTDDDTHPTDAGHAAMATQILAQIP